MSVAAHELELLFYSFNESVTVVVFCEVHEHDVFASSTYSFLFDTFPNSHY